MYTVVKTSFIAEYRLHKKLKNFFNSYGIQFGLSEELEMYAHEYSPTEENPYFVQISIKDRITMDTVSEIFSILQRDFQLDCSESVDFIFDQEDFNKSPFFMLVSTGNSSRAFLEHRRNCVEWKVLCEACGHKVKLQTSPLVMDTSRIGNRYMVNVGTDYWVISEKMAQLMEEWKITGYKLQEVIHVGKKNSQPAYQVIPTNTLPAWSTEMKHYEFITGNEDWCQKCNINGRVDYPYHYDKSDLEKYPIQDINIMKEWTSSGVNGWAYRPLFVSKRFRDLLIQNKITREVLNMSDNNYQSKDWFFEPVIVVDK